MGSSRARFAKAVMDAYAYVIPMIEEKTVFNLEHIKNIHKHCTKGMALNTGNMDVSDNFSGNLEVLANGEVDFLVLLD